MENSGVLCISVLQMSSGALIPCVQAGLCTLCSPEIALCPKWMMVLRHLGPKFTIQASQDYHQHIQIRHILQVQRVCKDHECNPRSPTKAKGDQRGLEVEGQEGGVITTKASKRENRGEKQRRANQETWKVPCFKI